MKSKILTAIALLALPMLANSQKQDLVLNVNDTPFELIYVEGGKFLRTCNTQKNEEIILIEKEKDTWHEVSSFYIGKYEITIEQYFVGTHPDDNYERNDFYKHPEPDFGWSHCIRYCNDLSASMGYEPYYIIDEDKEEGRDITFNESSEGFRLPTELEWEYAALGGKHYASYDQSTIDTNDISWNRSNSSLKTHAVGSKKPNKLGIYDMLGNLWEWVYDEYYYKAFTEAGEIYRMMKGGAYDSQEIYCQPDAQMAYSSRFNHHRFGIRVVKNIPNGSE